MLDWLAHRANISPQKTALIFGNRSWSYAALNNLVGALAAKLAASGVTAGQHVAVLLPNRVEFVTLIHALARLNAVIVPLNIRLTETELSWQVDQSDSRFLICDRETEPLAVELAGQVEQILSVDTSAAVSSLIDIPAADASLWQARLLNLDSLQGIIYTSGTTGQPKGAMLTHSNHFWSATASAYRLGTDPADRWLLCMPLYHVGGMAIVLRCCLYGTAVVLQNGFNEDVVGQALATQAVTLISVVPTMLHRLLESHRDQLANSQLRCVLVGGAAAPADLVKKCLALNLPVAATYGLTEAASQVSVHPGVREAMVTEQRRLIAAGPFVAEGRDIATVVSPDSPLKIFLTASPEERAERRAAQTGADVSEVLAAQEDRDRRDSEREHGALLVADDAVTIDSTGLTPDEVISRIAGLARERGLA